MKWPDFVTASILLLLLATIVGGFGWTAWLYMWSLAFLMFVTFKWITLIYHPAYPSGIAYASVYLLAWVGMDPSPFKQRVKYLSKPAALPLSGLLNMAIGIAFMKSTELISTELWLLQGWLISIGIVLILHFGLFKILAWMLRTFGFEVNPIMKLPFATRKISEFWGGRWNTAFTQLVNPFVFKPLIRKFGIFQAVVVTFLISGLIHELVISLPAKAGWGLPTLYFLIQAAGMMFERTPVYGALGRAGQRMFTYLIVAGPAIILFHPSFMKMVILPFARAIGISI